MRKGKFIAKPVPVTSHVCTRDVTRAISCVIDHHICMDCSGTFKRNEKGSQYEILAPSESALHSESNGITFMQKCLPEIDYLITKFWTLMP